MTGKGRGNNDPTGSRGREKARKGRRRVEDNTLSFPPSSEMPMAVPMSCPPPQGYSELPQHHEPYVFVQTPGLSSHGNRTIRPAYSPAASRPRGSHPSMSHPHGSHPSVSQPSVSQPLAVHPAMSLSQGSQPSSSATPSISGLRLRDSSSDPPTPSTHASDIHVSDGDADDDEEVHYDQYGRIIIVPEGDG